MVLAKAQRNHMNPLEIMWAQRKTLKEKRVLAKTQRNHMNSLEIMGAKRKALKEKGVLEANVEIHKQHQITNR